MIVYLKTFIIDLNDSKNAYVGLFTPKSVNCILKMDTIGTFFLSNNRVFRCRGPPFINLDFKSLN